MATGCNQNPRTWRKGSDVKKIYYAVLFLVCILIDRLSKLWALAMLSSHSLSIWYGFNLTLAWNKGISWSLFATDNTCGFWVLTSLIIAVTIAFALYSWYKSKQEPIFGEILVLAGACSNIIDRLWYGAVIDFIEFYLGSWSWPVFNLADTMVVLGVGWILLQTWWQLYERKS